MKYLLAVSLLFISQISMANQKLSCAGEGFKLFATLTGYQMTNMSFYLRSSKVLESEVVTYRKSHDMYSSRRFDPYIQYPIYRLSNMFYLSLPGGDMREGNFVALLNFSQEEIELECETRSL